MSDAIRSLIKENGALESFIHDIKCEIAYQIGCCSSYQDDEYLKLYGVSKETAEIEKAKFQLLKDLEKFIDDGKAIFS